MRIFEKPNMSNFKCPICGESTEKPVTLIPIDGTITGNNEKAEQVHVECLELRFMRDHNYIYMVVSQFGSPERS